MADLSGKTALVTGASRGIGRASAPAPARKNVRVLVHHGPGRAQAGLIVKEIRQSGGPAQAIAADLASAEGAHQIAKQVREIVGDRLECWWRPPACQSQPASREPPSRTSISCSAVNVRAPFFLVQQLPIRGDGASIVLVSLLAAHASVCALAAYAARKGAIGKLVKHFAVARGPRGIRFNAVAPGIVDTDMSNLTKTEAWRKYALNMQARQRVARP